MSVSSHYVKLGELPIKTISKTTTDNGIQKTEKVVKFAIEDGMTLKITIRRDNFEINKIIIILSNLLYI